MQDLFGFTSTSPKLKSVKKSSSHYKSNITKNNVLPHTQAKLNLYKDYLESYIIVLLRNKWVSKIYLYDIFCGNGIYDDGKPGSPVIALDIIKKTVADFVRDGNKAKPIYLIINDKSKKRLEKARSILDNLNDGSCIIHSFNNDAENMLQYTVKKLRNTDSKEKSLIFIDPYGYSKIRKSIIEELLSCNNSEILLFLPIAQMHRFSLAAKRLVNNTSFEPLRKFINEFLKDYDFKERIDNYSKVFRFINAIKDAFTFDDRYFSCSHYIQRDLQNNYYALFFITNHIYGLHKMLEAKWKEDKTSGDGFRINSVNNSQQISMFGDYHKESESDYHFNFIKDNFCNFLLDKPLISNKEVFIFILKLGYLPSKFTPILKKLHKDKIITMIYQDESKINRLPTYITWDDYKAPDIKVQFKLN